MKCKYCKSEIENDSVFCRFCGERVARKARQSKVDVSVPTPTKTKAGKYRGRLMVGGQRIYVTEDTEAAYYIRAKAVKAGMIDDARGRPQRPLKLIVEAYISDNAAVMSPATVKGYRNIVRNNFKDYMDSDISGINWQRMISEETERYAAKTVKNAWRLVTASLRYAKEAVPTVNLPKSVRKEKPFLDYEEIMKFVPYIQGHRYETAYLLALHSLRYSEILALNDNSCLGDTIRVRGAVVPGEEGMEFKELNKTDLSRRDVPIMIPRLSILIQEQQFPIVAHDMTLNKHLKRVCNELGISPITFHGLRHSFASLAYHLHWTEKSTMQIGGWSTPDVVHEIYTHLAKKDSNDDVERMRVFYRDECKS